MSSQLPARFPEASPLPARLLTRSQYKSCHVQIAAAKQAIAAIWADGRYYSFFKVVDATTARKLIARLRQRGDTPILTQTPKGIAIWVLEPDAQPMRRSLKMMPVRVLATPTHYHHCEIRVPDLNQNLSAIYFDRRYYSLFRAVEQVQQALQILNKLSDRGDKLVITKASDGYCLWILEPEAHPIE